MKLPQSLIITAVVMSQVMTVAWAAACHMRAPCPASQCCALGSNGAGVCEPYNRMYSCKKAGYNFCTLSQHCHAGRTCVRGNVGEWGRCVRSDTPDPPTLTVTPTSGHVVAGSRISLMTSLTQSVTSDDVVFRFFRDGLEVARGRSRHFILAPAQLRHSGHYSSTVSVKGVTSAHSTRVTLVVTEPELVPALTVLPAHATFAVATPVSLTCAVTTHAGAAVSDDVTTSYTIVKDDQVIATGSSVTLGGARVDSGQYWCTAVRDGRDLGRSEGRSVVIVDPPTEPTLQSQVLASTLEGDLVLLTCVSPTPEVTSYEFFKGGVSVWTDPRGHYLMAPAVKGAHDGTYTCVAALGEVGSTASNSVQLTLAVKPPKLTCEPDEWKVFVGTGVALHAKTPVNPSLAKVNFFKDHTPVSPSQSAVIQTAMHPVHARALTNTSLSRDTRQTNTLTDGQDTTLRIPSAQLSDSGVYQSSLTVEGQTSELSEAHTLSVVPFVNLCSPDPCQNGGRCVQSGTVSYCACPPGKGGDHCELAECATGWTHEPQLKECFRYEAENDQNLVGALFFCTTIQARLKAPQNEHGNNFVYNFRQAMGGKDSQILIAIQKDINGVWRTRDGGEQDGQEQVYLPWAAGEPDGKSSSQPGANGVNCAVMKVGSHEWEDETCLAQFPFICQKADWEHLCRSGQCLKGGVCMAKGRQYVCQCKKNTWGDQCENVCGGEFNLIQVLQLGITSPNYPDNYPPMVHCEWTIRPVHPVLDGKVKLSIEALDLESSSMCGRDKLEFFEKSSTAGTRIGTFCGSTQTLRIIEGRVNETLIVKFTSDQITQQTGFHLRVSVNPVHPCSAPVDPCGDGGRCMEDGAGYVCQCPAGAGGARCQNRQCEDGWSYSPCSKVCYLPTNVRPAQIPSTGFLTGSSPQFAPRLENDNDLNLAGAMANCIALKSIIAVPKTEEENMAVFDERTDLNIPLILGIQKNAPGGPQDNEWRYVDGTILTWAHWAPGQPDGKSDIQPDLTAVDCVVQQTETALWEDESCIDEFSFICRKEAYVHLCNDGQCLNGGVCILQGETFACQCPVNYYGDSCQYVCGGSTQMVFLVFQVMPVKSPDHPNSYPGPTVCQWEIMPTPFINENVVKLRFDTVPPFELEASSTCQFDSVEFFNGVSEEAPSLGKFCGSTAPSLIEGSKGSPVFIKFVSDQLNGYGGFKLLADFVFTG